MSSLLTSMAPRSGSRSPLPAQHGPNHQWYYLQIKHRHTELWEEGDSGGCNDCEHQQRGVLTTGRFIVDAVAVENKGSMGGVNADGHRSVFIQSQLEGVCISRGDVGVALDLCRELGRVHVAKPVLLK